MLRRLMLTAGLVAAVATASAISPADGHTRRYYRHYHHYHHSCRARSHRSGAIGAVAGAIGGGIIGSAITHGNGPSTLLGAGAGALTGNAIGRNSVHC